MRTEDLIAGLARGAGAVEPHAVARRYAAAIGWGAFGATLLMALLLRVRADIAQAVWLPMFWLKLGFAAVLFAIALALAARLARAAKPLGHLPLALALPVLVVWTMAAAELVAAPPGQRLPLVLGQTWERCPFLVTMLSLPTLAAAFRATRRLAPTRLVHAGAACGLVAGALAACIYALHCPEMSPAFLGTWYVIGMLIPTALGAALGPRLLRW